MTGVVPFRYRYVLMCGALWALGVTVAEASTFPIEDLSFDQFARFAVQLGLLWVGCGITWAVAAKVAEENGRFLILVPALVGSWLLGMAGNIVWRFVVPPDDGATAHLLTDIPFSDLAAYLFWSNAFYGGLYTAGYLLARRAGWQRASLAEQRRVRSEADGALREAQLVSLRGQLQPDLLIEALTVLQERYATDGTQGDELFDRLIGFLRAAMPGVRSGRSTLRAELDVLASYVTLLAVLPHSETLRFGSMTLPPEGLSFPPLILLPSIDAIRSVVPSGTMLTVEGGIAAGTFRIAIEAGVPIEWARVAPDLGSMVSSSGAGLSTDERRMEIHVPLDAPEGRKLDHSTII